MTYYVTKYSVNYLVHEIEQRIKKYKLNNVNIYGETGAYMNYAICSGKPKDKYNWKFFIYVKHKTILLSETIPGVILGNINILNFHDSKPPLLDLELYFKRIKLICEVTEKI